MLVNEYFINFRFRSFFIEREVICRFIVLFFETSKSGWASLTIDEGISTLTLESKEPLLLDLNDIDDDFAYPVQSSIELVGYIGKHIINIYEYRIKGIEDGCVGVYFDCGDCGFSILESEGCLSIAHGVHEDFHEVVILSKLEF